MARVLLIVGGGIAAYKSLELVRLFKKAGRALGRVRDLDVQLTLIRTLEDHTPQAAPALVLLRQEYEGERLAKIRRLIKTLERLDVSALLESAAENHPAGLCAIQSRLLVGACCSPVRGRDRDADNFAVLTWEACEERLDEAWQQCVEPICSRPSFRTAIE